MMLRLALNLVCLLVFFILPSMVMADPLNDGNQAEDRGDYATAFQDFSALAAQGNRAGEASVAGLYLTGKGVAQNCALALHYYALAAKQGDYESLHNFGIFFANGICMPQNYAKAVQIFTVLASHGFPKDEGELGHLYDNGLGVQQDFGKAANLFTLAAKQNDANAQGNLGLLYMVGQGEPQDNVQAYKWLTIAINNNSDPDGNSARASAVALFTQKRAQLQSRMTPADIAEAQSLAADWKPSND